MYADLMHWFLQVWTQFATYKKTKKSKAQAEQQNLVASMI